MVGDTSHNLCHARPQWLAANNKRAFLGEFNAIVDSTNNAECKTAVYSVLNYIKQNRNKWLGFAVVCGAFWLVDNDFIKHTRPIHLALLGAMRSYSNQPPILFAVGICALEHWDECIRHAAPQQRGLVLKHARPMGIAVDAAAKTNQLTPLLI